MCSLLLRSPLFSVGIFLPAQKKSELQELSIDNLNTNNWQRKFKFTCLTNGLEYLKFQISNKYEVTMDPWFWHLTHIPNRELKRTGGGGSSLSVRSLCEKNCPIFKQQAESFLISCLAVANFFSFNVFYEHVNICIVIVYITV